MFTGWVSNNDHFSLAEGQNIPVVMIESWWCLESWWGIYAIHINLNTFKYFQLLEANPGRAGREKPLVSYPSTPWDMVFNNIMSLSSIHFNGSMLSLLSAGATINGIKQMSRFC